MKQLTKAEEEVMQQLWKLKKCNVAAIINELPAPKPAYNTVSTIVRILESKGFVDHEQEGKGYLYFPVLKKSDYSNQSINKLVDGYFQGILEVIGFQLVFLIIYDFWLKKETFFQWNRAYLLSTYVVALMLPWVKIEALKTTVPQEFYVYPEFLWGSNNMAAISIADSEATAFPISWEYLLLFGGMFLASLFFANKLRQLHVLRRTGKIQRFADFTQIIITNSQVAFSFLKSIFLGDKVLEGDYKSVIEHELVHIKQGHTYDLLFFELMRIVCWYNPLVYVYQNRLAELHEFIADAQVTKTNRKEHYQRLLSQVFETQHISFINQFFK